MISSLSVIVLAGGKATRMGGVDKGLALHEGRPLISYVLEQFETRSTNIVISCNRNVSSYMAYGHPTSRDQNSSFAGPLAGITACRSLVTESHVLVVPCDTPYLSSHVIEHLAPRIGQHQIAVCHDGQQLQPLIFLARRSALDTIAPYLEQGLHSVTGWVETLNSVVVDTSQHPEWFWNINQKDQLNRGPEAKKPSI